VATLSDAERARDCWSDYLRTLGAHAVGVEEDFEQPGGLNYALVAYFPSTPQIDLPASLGIWRGAGVTQVPLYLRVAESFQPQ
jgi:hypothetical protein